MNHQLVRELRIDVAEALAAHAPVGLAEADRRRLARQIALDTLDGHWASRLGSSDAHDESDEDEVIEAVLASLFGLGRLQVLIDDSDIENINVDGFDTVWVTYADGTKILCDPIADSDDELVEMIRMAAARLGMTERRFDSARPELDLRLPDGSRMSAVMAVCERPSISIRRHRYTDLDLAQLVAMEMIEPEVADLLAAAVRARRNIIVSGSMNAGKTTLLRGLASEIPPRERIVTIEQALELGLEKMTDRHPDCVALEAREANTEGHGEITMARLVRRSLRMSADRVIVGEVLGEEVIPMLNAMSQGRSGSMCTIHSNSSAGVFRRIASYAAQAPERLSLEAVNLLIGGSIHFVVHVDSRYESAAGSARSLGHPDASRIDAWDADDRELEERTSFLPSRIIRRVASVREVVDADGAHVVSNEVWRAPAGERGTASSPLQSRTLEDLLAHGYEGSLIACRAGEAW